MRFKPEAYLIALTLVRLDDVRTIWTRQPLLHRQRLELRSRLLPADEAHSALADCMKVVRPDVVKHMKSFNHELLLQQLRTFQR